MIDDTIFSYVLILPVLPFTLHLTPFWFPPLPPPYPFLPFTLPPYNPFPLSYLHSSSPFFSPLLLITPFPFLTTTPPPLPLSPLFPLLLLLIPFPFLPSTPAPYPFLLFFSPPSPPYHPSILPSFPLIAPIIFMGFGRDRSLRPQTYYKGDYEGGEEGWGGVNWGFGGVKGGGCRTKIYPFDFPLSATEKK